MVNYLKLLKTCHRLKSFKHRNLALIKKYQLRRFKKIMGHAYENVKMYRKIYYSKGFHPSMVKRYEDITKVPIIDKDMIRSFPLAWRIDPLVNKKDIIRESTSGSTGEPLVILSDKTEGYIQSLKCVRFLFEWGYSSFDNTIQIWRDVHEPKSSILQKLGFFKREYISFIEDPDIKINKLKKRRCDVLFSSRSSLEILAEEIEERKIEIHPRILVSGSENITETHRRLFKRTFGCHTMEIYGCNETGNIAWECPEVSHHHHMHLDMETALVNYHNVKNLGHNMRVGSAIVTNLENYVMPFIRYNLKDLIVIPNNPNCPCGRSLPLLGRVLGREEVLLEYKGRMFNWHYFYNFFKDFSYIKRYKIVQTKKGKIEFRVHLIHDTKDCRKKCNNDLNSAFGELFAPFNVSFVKKFPMSASGKFKVIEVET